MEILGIIGYLLILFTIIIFIITIALYINLYNKKKHYKETEGVIIDIKEQEENDAMNDYGANTKLIIPIISYIVDGREYQHAGGYKTDMKIGNKIKVLYDIKNPQKCVTSFEIIFAPVVLTILTIAFFIASIILVL